RASRNPALLTPRLSWTFELAPMTHSVFLPVSCSTTTARSSRSTSTIVPRISRSAARALIPSTRMARQEAYLIMAGLSCKNAPPSFSVTDLVSATRGNQSHREHVTTVNPSLDRRIRPQPHRRYAKACPKCHDGEVAELWGAFS